MTTLHRRSFLKWAGGTALTVGLAPSRALAQTVDDHVLFFIFLRGAADGISILHPDVGSSPARTKYESWRRVATASGGTRITNGIPVLRGLSMHPALTALEPAIAAGDFSFVPGVAGAVEIRSHFQQMDLVESGSGTSAPLADGVLGRALNELVAPGESLGALALTPSVPYSLRRSGAAPALSVTGFARFDELRAATHRAPAESDLRARLARLYLPASGTCASRICGVGQSAVDALDDLGLIIEDAGVTGALASDLAGILAADADRRIKMLSLDLGGWDTHNQQGDGTKSGGAFVGSLAQRLQSLSGLLGGFYGAAKTKGVFNRVTTVVMTEFGRTTFENGTQGTDHGYGSVAMVLSKGVRSAVVPTGWFPASASAPFYATAERTKAMPRLIEHRQVFAEVLRAKFGLTNLSSVLPGYTFDAAAPRIF